MNLSQKRNSKADREHGFKLGTEMNTEREKAKPHNLNALLSVVLYSQFHTSLDVLLADRFASAKEDMTQMAEKEATTVFAEFLSHLKFSVEKNMSAQLQSLVDR